MRARRMNLAAGAVALALLVDAPAAPSAAEHAALPVAATCGTPDSFYLSFPVENRTAYTALINSVLDHSMPGGPYNADGTVVAHTGEAASNVPSNASSRSKVPGTDLYGFSNSVPFTINGQYDGAGLPAYLFYDGHDGHDFKTSDQGSSVDILAAADGRLTCTTDMTAEIDHQNGYKTQYLHMVSRVCTGGAVNVVRGQRIGTAGGVGGYPVHLHFSVSAHGVLVDPYGWAGQYADPLGRVSENLWRPERRAGCGAKRHPDGALVVEGSTYWLIAGGQKRGIPSESVLRSYGFGFRDAIGVSADEIACTPTGAVLQHRNGLRNASGVIYEVTDTGFKRGFPSLEILHGQGFRVQDAPSGSVSGVNDDPHLPTYHTPFRDGTLLCEASGRQCVSGATVFVVSNSRKKAFASGSALTSLGYRFEDVIPISSSKLNAIPADPQPITDSWVSTCQTGTVSRPAAPTLLGPLGQTSSNTPTFTWSNVGNASWYQLWVNGPSGFWGAPWYEVGAGSVFCGNNSCGVTPLNATDGTYTWWVRGWNQAGSGSWSSGGTFSRGAAPNAVTLASPSGSLSSRNPAFSWAPATGATWYRLWVTKPDGSVFDRWYQLQVATDITCSSSSCTASPTLNLPTGQHHWWVQAWNPSGYSPWSAGLQFRIQ